MLFPAQYGFWFVLHWAKTWEVRKETSISIRALRRFCREDILTAKREDGGDGRKSGGWKGRSFLYYIAPTAKIRAHVWNSLITSRKRRRGGVMHISRANDKLKSGNAACRACVPCMEGFWANRFVTFVRRRNSLRFSLGAFRVSCCPCSSWPRVFLTSFHRPGCWKRCRWCVKLV